MKLIKKSEGSAIAVERKTFQGADYIDVRSMYKTKESTEFLPTKKGVMIPADNAEEVAQAIIDACSSKAKDVSEHTKPLGEQFSNPAYVVVRRSVIESAQGSLLVKTSRMFDKKSDAFKKLDAVDKSTGKYAVARVKYGYIRITQDDCQFLAATFKVYGDSDGS